MTFVVKCDGKKYKYYSSNLDPVPICSVQSALHEDYVCLHPFTSTDELLFMTQPYVEQD